MLITSTIRLYTQTRLPRLYQIGQNRQDFALRRRRWDEYGILAVNIYDFLLDPACLEKTEYEGTSKKHPFNRIFSLIMRRMSPMFFCNAG